MISVQDAARPSGAILSFNAMKAAEHVAANGLVKLVEDWPGRQQMLGSSEGLLDGPKLLECEIP
jgi:hypothetical protein